MSLALLWEHTRALAPEPGTSARSERARWSARVRLRRQVRERVRFSHVTFYQPVVGRFDRFGVDSNTSLAADLTSSVAFTATLQEQYDSEATRRGARSNHDGQLLFGLRTTF